MNSFFKPAIAGLSTAAAIVVARFYVEEYYEQQCDECKPLLEVCMNLVIKVFLTRCPCMKYYCFDSFSLFRLILRAWTFTKAR